MALIIEDGSGVPGAQSYVTAVEAKAYAAERQRDFPAVDAAVEALLLTAVDYLESLRARYQGAKTHPDQALQWPRSGVVIDGHPVAPDAIPEDLKHAQMQLALAGAAGVDLLPAGDGRVVQSEQIDVIRRSYDTRMASSGPAVAGALGYLSSLFSAAGGRVSTVRV